MKEVYRFNQYFSIYYYYLEKITKSGVQNLVSRMERDIEKRKLNAEKKMLEKNKKEQESVRFFLVIFLCRISVFLILIFEFIFSLCRV